MMDTYPRFTKDMKKTHTILIPNMAPMQFRLMQQALHCHGYKTQLLGNCGSQVAQLGLKYVHNDTCYPALLVIGQFLDALNSGQYDLERTALLITQTGGGCRASNYIHLLRKALVKAGYGNIPVASLNFSGLEKDSGFKLTLPLIRQMLAAVVYGDLLMALRNQTQAYEIQKGSANALADQWVERIGDQFLQKKATSFKEMRKLFPKIVAEFAALPIKKTPKVKVGVVGEIYVKYSPLGNNNLEAFLASQDCEVNLPGLLGFVQYCISNMGDTVRFYGGRQVLVWASELLLKQFDKLERASGAALRQAGFYAAARFLQLRNMGEGIISRGNKMGEGWLLTAEMVELVTSGYENIVCAQPFGCLPNHICGKGMISRIRAIYPAANITPIDYDPSATPVNQENRIKLMLSVAAERLGGTSPQGSALAHGAEDVVNSMDKGLLYEPTGDGRVPAYL